MRIRSRLCSPTFALLAASAPAAAPAQDASAATVLPRALRMEIAPLLGAPNREPFAARPASARGATMALTCPLGRRGWLTNPARAVALLALPVAGISALVSEQRARAATGALVAGTAYAVGATVVLSRQSRCSSTSSLIYVWTPLAATAGAVIATR